MIEQTNGIPTDREVLILSWSQLNTVLAIVCALVAAVTAYFRLWMGSSLSRLQADLHDAIDRKYVTREKFDLAHGDHERRIVKLEDGDGS